MPRYTSFTLQSGTLPLTQRHGLLLIAAVDPVAITVSCFFYFVFLGLFPLKAPKLSQIIGKYCCNDTRTHAGEEHSERLIIFVFALTKNKWYL